MVARKLSTKRKKVALPRKIKTGLAAAPVQSFQWFSDYFRTDVEKKEISTVIKSWIKENYKGQERTILLSAPEYCYTDSATAATIQWKKLGYDWPEKWDGQKKLLMTVETIKTASIIKISEKEDSDKVKVYVKSPMEIVKERTSDFIANIEAVLDDYYRGVHLDIEEYSVYNEMIKADLNSFSAKHVVDYYIPLRDEIEDLVNNKPADLVEGYKHLSIAKRKEYLKLLQAIVSDAERYVLSKKAVRKPSKPKVKTADKQVAKLNYAKDSAEFKLTSINPTAIVGASRLYTFNVKYRTITEYVTERTGGFEIKGSTLQGIDADRSRSIRLRKPEEQLSVFLTKTPTAINKFWSELTTKTIDDVNGRINKDTILLRALDK